LLKLLFYCFRDNSDYTAIKFKRSKPKKNGLIDEWMGGCKISLMDSLQHSTKKKTQNYIKVCLS
jgi:hypothetical protein